MYNKTLRFFSGIGWILVLITLILHHVDTVRWLYIVLSVFLVLSIASTVMILIRRMKQLATTDGEGE
ncbi:hypothetical protein [Alicyclobacillus fodiniaquatilis]|jgi:hypothetical protein|uniref:Uncharacterized protein n=1 Tax=Alicyclobacillus fodiniaquatilis TaxID=1661150 RepID=A0ABW4JMF1_9BACL